MRTALGASRGRVIHRDHVRGIDDVNLKTARFMLGEQVAYPVFLTDQDNRNAVLSCGLDSALDFNGRSAVATHRIDCDLEGGHLLMAARYRACIRAAHGYSSAVSITRSSL